MSDYSKLSEISINSEIGLPSSDSKPHITSNNMELSNGVGKDSPGNSGYCGTNPEMMNGCHVNDDAPNACYGKAGDSSAAGSHSQTPIAICGMAFRLPGGLSTAQQYWDFLLAKGDARQRVPDSRYNVSAFHDLSGKPGTVISEYGYFLEEDIGCLDSSFFAMARMEVERLDPQQRLMLEVARECFDDAGVTNWRGKRIGCYMGSLFEDWCEMFARETQNWGRYRITAFGDFALSNRVSYEMDLQGPSMTIRTACSSSLVALHEAVVAISRNDCESAIVGGANLIMTPGSTTSMTEQNILSKDGSCKTFSAAANGYARGEAITAIYIKKLDDAVRAGDPIQAVIRGTATNHDGKTLGMTVPSADAQESLIRRAYEVAGIEDVWKTAYVECHGTGTPIGDPIESDAVGRVFGDKGVYIGSVKPNLGHTEGASGLVSVIKTVLALKHRTIPPNIKSVPLNPAIPFKETQLTVPTEPTTWPTDRLERASINSFGVGGTNAHVIIDSAARSGTSGAPTKETHESLLLLFSANTQKSLEKMVDNYRNFLEQDPNCIDNLAYTLANRREHLPYRTFAIASRGNLGTIHPIAKAARPATVIMVFTGQGAQWPRMGRSLLDSNLTFLESIRRLDEYLRTLSDRQPAWSIEEVLRRSGDKTRFNSAEFSQPLCTAVQIALVDTLAYMGAHPSAVVGHSSGEIAAAYAAGVLTAEEAILCAVHRGTVANDQQRPGAMAAIGMGWADTTKYLSSNVIIACDNSPQSVTISGDAEEVEAVIADIHRSQPSILAKKLPVDKAYHSFHMKDVGKQYNQLLKDALGEKAPTIPFFSSVTGKRVESTLDPRYWQRNLESPVLFRAAVTSILGDPVSKDAVFLEVGPHSALAGPLRQNFVHHSSTTSYVSVMIRNQNCVESLLAASGKLFTLHVPMDMGKLVSKGFCLPNLPTYPWNHDESYWYESRLSKEHRKRKHPLHELLGSRTLESTDLEPSWRNLLHLDVAAWIRDHKIDDDIVFPFAAYVAMASEAVRQISGINEIVLLRHILVNTALVVAEGKPTELVTNLRRHRLTDTLDSQWWEFSISSYNGYTWTKHCTGETMAQEEDLGASQELPSLPRKVHARKWFDGLQHGGLDLGQAFRNLADISASTSIQQATAKIINNKPTEVQQYHLHPTVVDSALQLLGVASVRGEARKHMNRLPTGCDNIALSRSVSDLAVEATTGLSRGSLVGNIQGVADGLCVLSMSGLRLEAMENAIVDDVTSTLPTARLHWGPDITFMDSNQLFKPSEDYARYEESLESLTRFCLLCSQTVLTEIDPDNAHLHKFRGWIKANHELVDGRSIQCIDDNGIRKQIDDIVNQLAGTPAYSAARTLQKVCNNIGTILSGQSLTWQALITDDTARELLEFIYRYDRSSFIKALAHTKPNLRILELGSRRGAPSADILESLTHADGRTLFSRYTLTMKGFISVSENQKKLPNLNYASLDIDQDPFEQGFEGHQYDLIIANNTLPSTDRTSTSLQYIKKLLHPRGILLTHQLYQSSKWINYIFGTDPNWWCGITNESNHGGHFHGSNLYDELVSAGFNVSNTMLPDSQNPVQSSAIITASPVITKETTRRISLLHRDGTRDLGPIMRELELQGYDVVMCTIHDCPPSGRDVVVLLDRDEPFFENIDSQSFDSFKRFVHNLNDAGILWVSRLSQMRCQDPRYAQVIGIARTMRSEMLLDFATCEVDDIDGAAHQLIQVLMKFQRRDPDDPLRPDFEYSIVNGVIHVGRFYPYTLSDEAPGAGMNNRAALNVDSAGRLSTLHWALQPVVPPLQPDEVEVEMYSVGLSFRDILVAMKVVELPIFALGLEGAGIVRRIGSHVKSLRVGDRVAMIGRGAFSTFVTTLEILCVPIPETLSFHEAATMFFPFLTAMHSLISVGGLEKGQSVLIHSACGGVGLAAIQIAQMVDAEVYVTVGTEEKTQHIMDHFNIPRARIFNSRDNSFLEGILHETHGKGVDLVLNSLSGELLHASWRCVAAFGKLVEIGKRDLIGCGKLDMNPFLANRSYCCVDLDAFRDRPVLLQRMLQLIIELYRKGSIASLQPTKVFDMASTPDAFRYMQRGQHIGRICVSIRKSPADTELNASMVSSPSSISLNESATYLLVGGLGGLGRAVSTWMVEKGACHLIYLSRNAGVNADDQLFFDELNSMGCHVHAIRGSVTNVEDVTRAVASAKYPLKGILQMSMVLRDENFSKMSLHQWETAVQPKVQGTWNLHNATVAAGLDLDFFVLFSSLSGIIGQPGQANYAGANTFLDAFVQYRNNIGLPASAIDIGAVGDVGYVSKDQDLLHKMAATGFKPLTEQQLLDALVPAMSKRRPSKNTRPEDSGPIFVDENNFVLGLGSTIPLNSPANRAVWRRDRRMAVYHNEAGNGSDHATSKATLKSHLANAKADSSTLKSAETVAFLAHEIGKKLFSLLMKAEEDLDASLSLVDLGMDSLVGIELCAWWKQVFGFKISVLEMLGKGTLEALGEHAAEGLVLAVHAERGDTVNGM